MKIHPAPTKCCQLHIHYFSLGFLRLSSSSTLSKVRFGGNSRVLGRPLTTVAGKCLGAKSKNNLVPAIQSRQHSTTGWKGVESRFIVGGLVPPPCIRANSEGAKPRSFSSGFITHTIFGSYISHSLIFFLSLSFARCSHETERVHRGVRSDKDQRARITLLCLFHTVSPRTLLLLSLPPTTSFFSDA